MKKLAWTMIFILLFHSMAWAAPIEFSGGVSDEFQYKEVVFLSGKPVVFVGTVNVKIDENQEEKKATYTFTLSPEDIDIEGKLTRKVTLITTYTPVTGKGQTIANTKVTRYTENVTIGQDTFKLTNSDIQFFQSDIIDNRPAIDFYSGNIQALKRYEINGGEGIAQVKITGGDVGYKNFWGSTQTQLLDYVYTINRKAQGENENSSWEGTVSVKVSDSTTKSLQYSQNEANFSSFNGGYIQVVKEGMISQYTYNLPRITDEGIDPFGRNQGTISLQASKVPKVERLIVPKFRDTAGHWAQQDIEKLYSLGVFEGNTSFFIPDGSMTRIDFVKAVVKACDIGGNEEADSSSKRSSRKKKGEVEEIIFVDIDSSHPDYQYVKKAFEKNIITRGTDYRFNPNEPLTKAEAVTILIRVLGLEGKAPAPGYKTSFSDDSKIPNWAKDAVYMAAEAGIIGEDNNNNVNAHKQLKRSEASALLVRFLEFLEKDLQKDYSENIIYYY